MKINLLRLGLFMALLAAAGSAWGQTYYWNGTGNGNETGSWGTNTDGTGSNPNFNSANRIFIIQNGQNLNVFNGQWAVSGNNSKVIIQTGGTITSGSYDHSLTLDMESGATWVHTHTTYSSVAFGSINSNSNFQLNNSSGFLPGRTYPNLILNSGTFNPGATNMTINGDLRIQSGATFQGTDTNNPTHAIGGNVTIESGGTWTMTNGSGNPTYGISGTITNGGSIGGSSGVSTINFNGSNNVTANWTGSKTYSNHDINIASTKSVIFSDNLSLSTGRSLTVNGNLTVNGTLATGGTVTNNGSVTINDAFQINEGGWATGTGFVYGSGATLLFNTPSSYGVNNDAYWPASNGPANVTIQGAGGITMNVARTVSGIFQTSAGTLNGNNLTFNGIARINAGGYFTGSPTYGSASTLVYNTGTTYGRGAEWNATSGAGYPNNVTINSGSSLDLGANSGTGTARQIAGNLTLEGGLYMDFGSNDMTQPLTVLGNIAIGNAGILSLSDASGGDLYVRGNWSRTGGGSFNPKNRAVFFTGTSGDQTISGATAFDYLILNKASGNLSLSDNTTINQTLTLTNGKITLGSGNLTVNGSISGGGASSYIVTDGAGALQMSVGAGATKDFPIGASTGSYDPVSATPVNASTIGARVQSSFTVAPPIPDKAVGKEWDITSSSPSSTSLSFTPSDPIATTSPVIGHYVSGNWEELSATRSGNTWTATTTSFSPFGVGQATAFPIELLSFSAKPLASSIRLDWATASEQNNDYMAVEKSAEGRRWEELGRVAGAGTTTLPQSYTLSDDKPLPGLNYYRLRQVDFDGRFEYHKTIAVDFNGGLSGGLHLFPSPAKDHLNVTLPAAAQQDSELWLLDAQGRILQRRVVPQGGAQAVFEVSALPEGVYFVRMQGDVRSFRFVR